MYLSRLTLNRSRAAILWLSNPYRVHQRLKMACDGDPRLLFRIEEGSDTTHILVQSHTPPNWQAAFADLSVLAKPAEQKTFEPELQAGRAYHYRLLANPTIKKTVDTDGDQKRKIRMGIIKEEEQINWLTRKLKTAGADLIQCTIVPRGLQHSHKGNKEGKRQTHLAVLFEGMLVVRDPLTVTKALEAGIGSAKGYGFGLLSLAPEK